MVSKMAKKSFKDATKNVDRFFSAKNNTDNTINTNDTENTNDTYDTDNALDTYSTYNEFNTNDTLDTYKTDSTDDILNSDSEGNINDTKNEKSKANQSSIESSFTTTLNIQPEFFKFELKMPLKYKEFLLNESWKQKKSITEYINDLIKEDIKESHIIPNPLPTKRSIKPIYRITLKTPFINYLRDQSFKTKKSVTEYINDLIKAKKEI